jgi:hypothetical protein
MTTSRSIRLNRSASACVNGRPCGVISTTADAGPALGGHRFDRPRDRLGLHHHPRPATERHIVNRAMPILGELAQVAGPNLHQARLARAGHHTFRQRRFDQAREDR